MERLLARLERRFGRYAPTNLIWFIVGGSGLVYLMTYLKPEALGLLTMDLAAVRAGEVWRLVTFLFLPWGGGTGAFGVIFTIFALLFLHTIGTTLEAQWGALRFDLYYLLGALGTIAAALFVGSVTNEYLNLSLLLAFATEFPEYEILLLILPLRVKWLGLFSGGLLVWSFVTGSPATRAGIAVAMLNYLLFFAGPLVDKLRGRVRKQQATSKWAPEPRKLRVCALCGKSEADDKSLEFRVCDCAEKCHGKLTEFCLEHARAH
jgi:hypothetical protein